MILAFTLLQAETIGHQVISTGSKIDEMGVVPSMLFLAVLVLAYIVWHQYKHRQIVDSARLEEQAKVYEARIAEITRNYEARIADLKDITRK